MTNSSSETEAKRGNNTVADISNGNNPVNGSNAILQQGEVSSLTPPPPPQSQYPTNISKSEQQPQQLQHQHQQQQAYAQQIPNYYSYPVQTNGPTDQPNSPGPGQGGYDVQAAFHQQQAAYFDRQYGSATLPQLPLTPGSNPNSHVGMAALGVGPTSPNFAAQAVFSSASLEQMEPPNMNRGSHVAPPSPGIALPRGFVTSAPGVTSTSSALPGYGGVYQTYINPGLGGVDERHTPLSPQSSMQQQMYQQALASPQFPNMPYIANNVPQTAASVNERLRTQSFEEMLPPSTMSSSDSLEQYPQYQQNMGGTSASSGSGTLFALPQPWGFSSTDMYSGGLNTNPHSSHIVGGAPGYSGGNSPSQGRGMPPHASRNSGSGGRGGYHGNQGSHPYYQHTATTPGPPIQTTTSNKGPDGANLFIFHIPNHFTNLDMYKLFCTYGNLLSVRIMVEKDTGRSRGFGFVSYDTPESAAMAIKELNGFVIGNKRLKVQHKQIKPDTKSAASSNGTSLFYNGQKEQHEPISHDTNSGNAQSLDLQGNNEGNMNSSRVNDTEEDSALNHFDAIRNSLPDTSG